MSQPVTLAQVEQLAFQLPVAEQRQLLSDIQARLPGKLHADASQEEAYRRRMEEFLKMCDDMAVETGQEFDSAEEIRQIREERASRL